MNPYIEDVLVEFSKNLVEDLAPQIESPYVAAQLSYMSMILAAAGEEVGRSAWRLREDNRGLRQLFKEIMPLISDSAIIHDMEQFTSADDEDIHLFSLRRINEAMRSCVSRAHAIIEVREAAEFRAAEDAIWRELSAATDRRRVSIEMF